MPFNAVGELTSERGYNFESPCGVPRSFGSAMRPRIALVAICSCLNARIEIESSFKKRREDASALPKHFVQNSAQQLCGTLGAVRLFAALLKTLCRNRAKL
jgi:hypothetical protein